MKKDELIELHAFRGEGVSHLDVANDFLTFTKERHAKVWEEFCRYQRRDSLPAIGTKVKTLVSGYGGYGYDERYVVEIDDRYISLAYSPKNKSSIFLCEIKEWWRDLEIIEEPKIEITD